MNALTFTLTTDGDFDPHVLESTIKPPSEEMLQDDNNDESAPGRRVQAPWKGGSKLWPGRVLSLEEATKYVEEKLQTKLAAKIQKIEEDALRQVASLKSQVEGALSSTSNSTVYIKYDDGDEDTKAPLSQVVPKEGANDDRTWTPSDPSSLIGFKVMAPWKGGTTLFPGTITELRPVFVKFDDGDEDRDVPLSKCMLIEPPDTPVDPLAENVIGIKVMAPYKGSKTLYPGTIAERLEESQEEKDTARVTTLFALAKTLA